MKIGMMPTEGPAAFAFYVKCLLAARGNGIAAAAMAESAGADTIAPILRRPFVAAELKDAVLAGSTISWGSPLAQFHAIVSSFEDSLRPFGFFDACFPATRRIPYGVARYVVLVTGASGSGVYEGAAKPISSLQIDGGDIAPVKATAAFVITKELARLETPQGFLADALRVGAAVSADRVFIPGLIDTATPSVIASGTGAAQFLADLSAAVASTSLSARSRLFLAVDPLTSAALAMMEGDAFADMTVSGGFIRGIQVVPTDAIQRDTAGAQLVLMDASEIAAATATIRIDASEHATLQIDNEPANSPNAATVMTPLWQQDKVGMKAERWFSFKRLRDNAVVTIENASYGG